jgi:hypothetical protein
MPLIARRDIQLNADGEMTRSNQNADSRCRLTHEINRSVLRTITDKFIFVIVGAVYDRPCFVDCRSAKASNDVVAGFRACCRRESEAGNSPPDTG